MRKISPILLGLSLVFAVGLPAPAQDQPMMAASAPKYLQVIVEYTKPGRSGMAHDRTESAFVQTMIKAKFPIHYTAFNALSGKPRAIFLSGFNSFEEMDTANKLLASPAVAADYERDNVNDGELLEDMHTLIFSSVPELSYHSKAPTPQERYMEAEVIMVRPGHSKEFHELAKMVMDAEDKAGSSDHWGAYHLEYGDLTGTYVLLTSSNSATEIDERFAESPKYTAGLSDDDKKKMNELRAAAIESSHHELYSVNPGQSYVSESWIKADPDFWKPKHAAAPAAKAPAEKKANP